MNDDYYVTENLRFIKRVAADQTYQYIATEKVLQQLWRSYEDKPSVWRDVPIIIQAVEENNDCS